MTSATWRRACQRKAGIHCEGGRNFHDSHNFHVFTASKKESFSFIGGIYGMEVMVVMEDRAETDLSPRCLDPSQTDASRVIRDARACGTSPRRSMTAGR